MGVRKAAPAAVGLLALGVALSACGPSPMDMEEHPITESTPSRAAGEELLRSGEPEEACPEEPLRADSGATVSVASSTGRDADEVRVPTEPERILALGYGAADTACALGLQDRVVATSPLPADANAVLPPRLTSAPIADPATAEFSSQVRDLDPDVILIGADAGMSAAELRNTLGDGGAPIISYEDPDSEVPWSESAKLAAAALGREQAMDTLLTDFIGFYEGAAEASTPSDTQVSVVQFDGGQPRIADPNILGVRILTAMGAQRPPAQLLEDGEPVDPPDYSPIASDELSGDVIFAIKPPGPGGEAEMRSVFESERWEELSPMKNRRVFVVEPSVWQGRGIVAARTAVVDIAANINRYSADG